MGKNALVVAAIMIGLVALMVLAAAEFVEIVILQMKLKELSN
jgi:hypothetical protein